MMSQIIWFISFHVGIRIMENFHRHRNGFIVPAIWRTNYRNKHRIYEIKTPIIPLIERGISMGRFVCVQNRHCWSLLAIFEPLKNYFITCQKKWPLLRPSVSTVRPTRKVSLGPAKVRETPVCLGLWCSGACNRRALRVLYKIPDEGAGCVTEVPIVDNIIIVVVPRFPFQVTATHQ